MRLPLERHDPSISMVGTHARRALERGQVLMSSDPICHGQVGHLLLRIAAPLRPHVELRTRAVHANADGRNGLWLR